MAAEEEDFVFNGINGATGGYITPPMSVHQVAELARSSRLDEVQEDAAKRHEAQQNLDFAARADVDCTVLAQAGWGVIFAHDEDPGVREALQPLLDLRKSQASAIAEQRYRELSGGSGYRRGERKPAFLKRHEAPTSGPIDPDRMPYYLLIVGGPEKIPTEFQSQLALQNAVGRLCFDTPDEYANYARTVIAAERGELVLPRRLGLFGVKNDRATTLSAEGLIGGLDHYVQQHASEKLPAWRSEVHSEADATKAQLTRMLGGPDTPAVLFTASHGMGFPNGHADQLRYQGALLCQDWTPEPREVPRDAYFAGEDLSDSASLAGLIAFLFACYGGGTPVYDAFSHRASVRNAIAPRPFFAELPRRMLGHPRGGALAAVGHVERAWGCSFYTPRVGHQIAVFESFMYELLRGKPIGMAMESFGTRYGELSAGLVDKLDDLEHGGDVTELEVASDWTANNDARNYLILGDPAVRVAVADDAKAQPRPVIELQSRVTADPSASPGGAPDEAFGLFSRPKPGLQEGATGGVEAAPTGGGIIDSLRGFVTKLGDKISDVVSDMGTLEVTTYVAKDMSEVRIQGGQVMGAELRAYTRVSLDGDTVVVVPERDGEIDESALQLHTAMVQQAQRARGEMLAMVIQVATNLAGLGK